MTNSLQFIREEKLDGSGIWVLTIDHPPVNILNFEILEELEKALDQFQMDTKAKVAILTGAGERAFSAGADLNGITNIKSSDNGEKIVRRVQTLFNKIENSEKPIIAAINNLCLGGGSELMLACHIRVASERAKFGQPEINLGIIPGWGGTQRLPRLIGISRARKLILTGDIISAKEAFEFGLVDEVVAHGHALNQAIDLAKRITRNGQMGVRLCQRAIREGMEKPMAEGLEIEIECFRKVCQTDDMKEGLKAYKDKRVPEFKDR